MNETPDWMVDFAEETMSALGNAMNEMEFNDTRDRIVDILKKHTPQKKRIIMIHNKYGARKTTICSNILFPFRACSCGFIALL